MMTRPLDDLIAMASHPTNCANLLGVGGASFVDTYATLQVEKMILQFRDPYKLHIVHRTNSLH